MPQSRKVRSPPPLLEWIASMLGALLALAAIGFVLAEELSSSNTEPALLEVRQIDQTSKFGMHVIEIEVANKSAQTAADVEIEGTLNRGVQTVETSGATVSYVPGHSTRRAGLVFTNDPGSFELELRATGYEVP